MKHLFKPPKKDGHNDLEYVTIIFLFFCFFIAGFIESELLSTFLIFISLHFFDKTNDAR